MSPVEIAAIYCQDSAASWSDCARNEQNWHTETWAKVAQIVAASRYAAARTMLGIDEHPFQLPELQRNKIRRPEFWMNK